LTFDNKQNNLDFSDLNKSTLWQISETKLKIENKLNVEKFSEKKYFEKYLKIIENAKKENWNDNKLIEEIWRINDNKPKFRNEMQLKKKEIY
jgi:hypothetical protein